MTAIRMDGFDAYQSMGASLTSNALGGTGYSLYSTGGERPIVTAEGTTKASMSFQFRRGTDFLANMSFAFRSDASRVIIGFAVNGNSRGSLFKLNNLVTIDWLSGGPLGLNGKPGPNTIVLRRWYYLELVIDKTARTVTLFVNNVEFVKTDMPADLSTVTDWSAVFGWQENGEAGTLRFDDLVIIDNKVSGDGITGRLGPVEQLTSLALTNPVNEFSNAATGQTPVQVVSRIPPTEGAFLESSRSGARQLFANDQVIDERDVLAVTVQNLMSKTDLDDRTMGIQLETDEGVHEQVVELGLEFRYYQMTRALDPSGAPFTARTINASQWGAVIRP